MRKLIKLTSLSLSLLICSPIATIYAEQEQDSDIIEMVEIEEETIRAKVMKLTLESAIKEALENSSQIEQSKLDLEKAEVNYRENKYDIRQMKKMLRGTKETSLPYIKGVTIPEKSNDFGFENAKKNNEIIKNNIEVEVEELYFNVVQAQEFVEFNKSNVELTKKLEEISVIKQELGLGINQEVLNAKLNHRKSVESLEDAEKNLKNAKMLLNKTIGLDLLQKVELLDQITEKSLDLEEEGEANKDIDDKKQEVEKIDIEYYIERALKNRNEIKMAEFQYELEELTMDTIRKEFSDITFMYKEQEVALEKSKEALENAKKGIELEVRSSYKNMNQKKEELNSAEQSLELAKEALRIAQVSYDVGVGIAIDVEKAENALKQAELGLLSAINAYNSELLNFEIVIDMGKGLGGN